MTELLPVSKADLETVLEALLEATGHRYRDDNSVYLETHQIDAMRRLGQAMGLDPITVTPESERSSYPHRCGSLRQVAKNVIKDMGPGQWLTTIERVNVCSLCGLSDGDKIHMETSTGGGYD